MSFLSANLQWHVLSYLGSIGSLAVQGTAFPSCSKLLLLHCLHGGKFICCGFFLESSNVMLMRTDRKVTAQGRRGWEMCPELGSASLAPLKHSLDGAVGTSLAELGVALLVPRMCASCEMPFTAL